jgi:uncharacterized protein YjbJ (UPF0337 family)
LRLTAFALAFAGKTGRDARKTRRGGGSVGDKSDRASGTVKEAAGKATRNPDLAAEGRREQIKGDVKKSGKKLKDAAKKM